MVASGRVAYLTHRGVDYGVRTGRVTIDMKRVRARKRDIVKLFRNANQKRIEMPKHLLILGGGYVGLEFGQLFRRLGSKVTVVHSREQLLTQEDADVAQEVAAILKQDGVKVLLNAKAEGVKKTGSRI